MHQVNSGASIKCPLTKPLTLNPYPPSSDSYKEVHVIMAHVTAAFTALTFINVNPLMHFQIKEKMLKLLYATLSFFWTC